MSSRAKGLEARLLDAGVRRDNAAIKQAADECGATLKQAELVELLRRMTAGLSAFAARVPEGERQAIASQLANAEAILRMKGFRL